MDQKIQQFQQMITDSQNIVFFGGAGVSTASGIPDFRSADGIYSKEYKYPPEVMISHSFYRQHPEDFFDFYKNQMIYTDAEPNAAHYKLTQWENQGKLTAVVTQNIDGLHQKAGTKNVHELHGSVLRNYCETCRTFYDVEFVLRADSVPLCTQCGGTVKPDVVLYEESLNSVVIEHSIRAIANADLLIVGGTSLTVYPAAGFVDAFNGKHLVIVNMSATGRDSQADLVLAGDIAKIFEQL